MVLELTTLPDDDWYGLNYEYFTDSQGRYWRNEGGTGDRPMRLVLCHGDGCPKHPIWNHVDSVKVDGADVPFFRFDMDAWRWEDGK